MLRIVYFLILAFLISGATLRSQTFIDPFQILPIDSNLSKSKVFKQQDFLDNSQSKSASCPCTISQDVFSMNLPFFSHNESATSFYSYSNPLGSCANTGFEQSNHLILMLYEDTNSGEVSFIFIADLPNDGSGGTMDVTISCLPNSAYIALSDDAGELTGSPPTMIGDFFWDVCCTDGGVISGLGCNNSFIFDMDNLTGIDIITILYGSPSNPVYINLPSSECPFIFNCGGDVCCANLITIDEVIQNANCALSSDGSIDIEVSGDCLQQPDYEWSNGETTEDLANLIPGTYTVTVSDPNGCSVEETYTIGIEYPDPIPTIDGPSWFCEGETVALSVIGNYNVFIWSTGVNGPQISISEPGAYSVTVTTMEGCTGVATISIDEFPAPVPEITGPLEICPGGLIELVATPGFALYEWSNGGYNPTNPVSDPGIYSVIVTTSDGCTGETSVEVTELPGPEPLILGPNSICNGQTIILEVEDIFNSYLWSAGDTIYAMEVTAPGIYSVTVTNLEGCPGVAIWEVLEGITTPLSIMGDSIRCKGDSAILFASGLYMDYLWSTGDTVSQIQVIAPGTYTLAVMDDQGCRDTATVFIDTFPETVLQIIGNTMICPGDTIMLSAGIGFNGFLWSTGEQTMSISVFTPGIYAVVAQDANHCSSTDSVEIMILPADTVLLFTTSCNPQDTGVYNNININQFGCDSVTVLSVGYSLADSNYVNLTTCNSQEAGVVVQHFTNQFNCDSVVIFTTSLLPSDTVLVNTFSCDPTNAGLDTFLLSNQWGCDSTVIIETLYKQGDTLILSSTTCDKWLADTSIAVFSNHFGCDSTVISSVSYIGVDTQFIQTLTCDSALVGTYVDILPGPYCDTVRVTTRDWASYSTGLETVYSCEMTGPLSDTTFLTSSSGCDSLHIRQYEYTNLNANLLVTNETCDGLNNGTIIVENASGGLPPYSYRLDNGTWLADGTFNALPPGVYQVEIRDSEGCTSSYLGLIIQSGALVLVDAGQDWLVEPGVFIDLSAQTSQQLALIQWTAVDPLSCATCLNTQLGPVTVEQAVLVFVQTPDGCTGQDVINISLFIKEIIHPSVFIPNSFSPNFDGINDVFSIYSNGEVASVRNMAIYDRWGNALFSRADLPVNDPSQGWDGTYKGKFMDPGVYIYVVELEFLDGSMRLYKGDVTVIK